MYHYIPKAHLQAKPFSGHSFVCVQPWELNAESHVPFASW